MTFERSEDAPEGAPSGSGSPDGFGLTAECRAFLRAGMPDASAAEAPVAQHLAACAFCSARLAARQKLGVALRVRPPAPQELRSSAFLDGIRTRIIEQCEQAPLGALLERAMPVQVPAPLEGVFPEGLLQSDLSRTAVQAAAGADAGEARVDSEIAWSRIRNGVLAGVGEVVTQERAGHRLLRTKGMALASVAAAAAIICAMLVSEGTTTSPTIVITDVATMPSVEFSPMAVLRHGAIR